MRYDRNSLLWVGISQKSSLSSCSHLCCSYDDTMQLTNILKKAIASSFTTPALVKQIKECTEVSRNHMTPEIALHLITPNCSLWSAKQEESPFHDPFWAFHWPGGQALSRYILDNKELICGRRILDVGSGCGACSIAAALHNSAEIIIANDIDEVACTAIGMNCSVNNVSMEISCENLIGTPCENIDLIIVGDMFYDSDFGEIMFSWLKELASNGKYILVGDPGRHAFKDTVLTEQVQCVIEYTLNEQSCMENSGFSSTSVWKFM
ncbi:electron transfer flavoprotein beta subunit lysine methyltransferase isoform X2 [Nilaparvata lugens]|uniref:electron transfer flavoprotein beta subunit lysine methyltransferase isoform X2 n=1 Tax=Nilaparvata lugens TaxID=108931 RepID=UPI00193D12DF|nr:electron transfer flavoprotein beta subunit lysine methyltransferase isoform X2 [Nilaparvata lugens]